MEFKLNEYRQGVTDEELLNNVRMVSELIGDQYISYSTYRANTGKYSESTFRNRFGSWLNVLNKLGLRTQKNAAEMRRIPNEAIIADLQRVAQILNSKIVTSIEYGSHGRFSFPTIQERFGNWGNFVLQANLDPTGHVRNTPDAELFIEIERIWIVLGKQPTTTEMKKGISRYALATFTRRFGGWRNALQAFLEYVDKSEDEKLPIELKPQEKEILLKIEPAAFEGFRFPTKKTTRNINLKIRFTVLQRDKFRCCSCGASPAKIPEIELHVDHIVPWSKGGETEIQNLQTLCSKCNLGKSNSVSSPDDAQENGAYPTFVMKSE